MIPEVQALIISFLPWEEIEQRELLLFHFPHIRTEWYKATKFDERVDIKKKTTIYTVNGIVHREDGPAIIISPDGSLTEHYYIKNVRHRETGPAYIKISADGSREEEIWRNGVKY